MLIRVVAHHGLEHGGGQLEGEGDHADLHKAQREVGLQQGIEREDQRLQHIVKQMREADRPENAKCRAPLRWRRVSARKRVGGLVRCHKMSLFVFNWSAGVLNAS